jgi:spore coat protein U-like protein
MNLAMPPHAAQDSKLNICLLSRRNIGAINWRLTDSPYRFVILPLCFVKRLGALGIATLWRTKENDDMLAVVRSSRWLATIAAVCAALGTVSASIAATATSTFTAKIVLQSNCLIVTTNTLDFGTVGVITANVDQTATFQVQCTNTTTYNIGLNAGSTSGGTTTTRKMTSGSATIDYKMFSDSPRTTNWGNTVGTDTVADTGTGSAITYTIYGRVAPQSTPAPNTYTDTVTITVTY